jgi:hypothetical protein
MSVIPNAASPLNPTKIRRIQSLPYSKSHFEVQRRPDRQAHMHWICLLLMLVNRPSQEEAACFIGRWYF